jgi:hypothetical protein
MQVQGVTMKRFLMISVALGLAACGTPQQQCIAQVSRDLRVVDRLIVESEGNLARGYAYADVVRTRTVFEDCTPHPTPERPNPRPRQCLEEVSETVSRPVAIDLNVEAAKLASLKARRTQMATATAQAIAVCQQQYPE